MFWKWVKTAFGRVFFFYLACFLVVWLFLDFPAFKKNTIEQAMNRLPSINFYDEFFTKKFIDPVKLNRSIYYHQRVVEYFSFERAEAYSILGYLYDLKGDSKRAVKSYKACLDINPNYFWPFYNLGLGAFKKGNYFESIEHFQQALDRNINLNIMLLMHYKVYTDIRLSDPNGADYNFSKAIMEGREHAYIFIMESLARMEKYERLINVAVVAMKDNITHKDIFYFYAGKAAFHLKSYDKALLLLNTGLQMNPHNVDIMEYLGRTLEAMGNTKEAVKFIDRAKQFKDMEGAYIERFLSVKPRVF